MVYSSQPVNRIWFAPLAIRKLAPPAVNEAMPTVSDKFAAAREASLNAKVDSAIVLPDVVNARKPDAADVVMPVGGILGSTENGIIALPAVLVVAAIMQIVPGAELFNAGR